MGLVVNPESFYKAFSWEVLGAAFKVSIYQDHNKSLVSFLVWHVSFLLMFFIFLIFFWVSNREIGMN